MSDKLIHFPLYIGEAIKDFIERPTFQERGAWLSIVVGYVLNDGPLPTDDSIYFKCMISCEEDKQVLKQTLSKCLSKTKKGWESEELNALLSKQKEIRDKRKIAGRKGGHKSQKNRANIKQVLKQVLKQSEPEPEPELELDLNKKNQKEKTAYPQTYPQEGSFLEINKYGCGWNIEKLLLPEELVRQQENARLLGWDWIFLMQRYHKYHTVPPDHPDKAFKKWLLSFTKGKSPT